VGSRPQVSGRPDAPSAHTGALRLQRGGLKAARDGLRRDHGGGNCTQNKKLSESDEVGEFGLGSVWTRICRSRNTLSRPTGMRHPYHLLRTRLGFAICHVVEDSYPSSELSLFRTRLERTRISRTGTNGEDSAVANCVVVRLMPWLTGDHFPSAIAGSHPRRGSPGVTM